MMKKIKVTSTLVLTAFLLLTSFRLKAQQAQTGARPASLRVILPDAQPTDTLRLLLFSNVLTDFTDRTKKHTEQIAVLNNGAFDFIIDPFEKPIYFSLCKEETLVSGTHYLDMLAMHLLEPGDSVTAYILKDSTYIPGEHIFSNDVYGRLPEIEVSPTKYVKQYKHHFAGIGADKFRLREEVDRMMNIGKMTPDQKKARGLFLIDSLKGELSPYAFALLKADLVGQIERNRLKAGAVNTEILQLKPADPGEPVRPDIIALSKYYPLYLLEWYTRLNRLNKEDRSVLYTRILEDYPEGAARDKLITLYLLRNASMVSADMMGDALKRVKTPSLANEIRELHQALVKGSPAFNFSLQDAQGRTVRLSDFKGKVVLMDFWFTGCGGCQDYFRSVLSPVEEELKDRDDVVFISVSVDNSKKVWLDALASKRYTSEHAVNLFTGGRGPKDPVIEHYKVKAYPTVLLIDKKGRILTNKYSDLRSGVKKVKEVIEAAGAM